MKFKLSHRHCKLPHSICTKHTHNVHFIWIFITLKPRPLNNHTVNFRINLLSSPPTTSLKFGQRAKQTHIAHTMFCVYAFILSIALGQLWCTCICRAVGSICANAQLRWVSQKSNFFM